MFSKGNKKCYPQGRVLFRNYKPLLNSGETLYGSFCIGRGSYQNKRAVQELMGSPTVVAVRV